MPKTDTQTPSYIQFKVATEKKTEQMFKTKEIQVNTNSQETLTENTKKSKH